jgi:hypothetical protein
MKKTIALLIVFIFFFSKIYSQEIRTKRQFFVPYPQYFVGEQYIGNSTADLIRFIESHSQDSIVIGQLYDSEKLSQIYPKIYLYSACAVGAGGLGMAYVFIKGTNDVLKNQTGSTPYLTIFRISLGAMSVGMAGIVVAAGYFISSQVKLRKAIKGYNNSLQPKMSFEIQPFMDANFRLD